MPYIKKEDKVRFILPLEALSATIDKEGISSGDFNYILTKIADLYLKKHGQSYAILKDIIGTFECAKLEFYFRVVRPYEDKKIEQNGDVFVYGPPDNTWRKD